MSFRLSTSLRCVLRRKLLAPMADVAERAIPPDRQHTSRRRPLVARASAVVRVAWRCVLVGAGVLFVVVPFGYAASGDYVEVVTATGYGLVVGLGISLRTQGATRGALGLLAGSVVGMVTVQILANLPQARQGPLNTLPTAMALALALVDGFGEPRLQGYRDAIRETLVVSLLFTGLAFLPVNLALFLGPWFLLASTALIAGFFSVSADGSRFGRPPVWLVVAALAMMLLLSLFLVLSGEEASIADAGLVVLGRCVLVPVAVFVCARAVAAWLHPRLLVYGQLVAYLRVMWVPIGGFAIGYLVIVVLFAGFYGMLAHFSPGAFTGAAEDTGILA